MSVAQEHNSNADGLRGIACLAVFFSHLAYTFYPYMHAAESMRYSFESYIMNSPFSFLLWLCWSLRILCIKWFCFIFKFL